MFRTELETFDTGKSRIHLFFDIVLILREFAADIGANFPFQRFVRYDFYSAEHYHALYVQCPLTCPAVTAVTDTKAYFITGGDRIVLMAGLGAMKIKLPIVFAIKMIHWYTVRISSVAYDREHSSGFVFQDL